VFLVLPAGIAVADAHESRRQAEEEAARLAARDRDARKAEAAAAFRAATDELRDAAALLERAGGRARR
jgi:hypothetical protein